MLSFISIYYNYCKPVIFVTFLALYNCEALRAIKDTAQLSASKLKFSMMMMIIIINIIIAGV